MNGSNGNRTRDSDLTEQYDNHFTIEPNADGEIRTLTHEALVPKTSVSANSTTSTK